MELKKKLNPRNMIFEEEEEIAEEFDERIIGRPSASRWPLWKSL